MKIQTSINQIDIFDDRYYQIGEDYYPSVTEVLDLYPKGRQFQEWLKDVGQAAGVVAARAAEAGNVVHSAIHNLIAGREINWHDALTDEFQYHSGNYTLSEWQGILRFVDFYKKVEKVEASEMKVFSKVMKYAGTTDMVCQIAGQRWLIDYKFGNALHESYNLQVAAYATAFQEMTGKAIDRIGILHLKAATRTEKEFQGIGWQLKECPLSINEHFRIFKAVLDIYYYENPNATPKNLSLPIKIKL
jgi:hypothetical protein